MKKTLSLILPSLFVLAACGGGGSSNSTSENGLSESYPTDLAITSPFGTESAVQGLFRQGIRQQGGDETLPPPTFDAKEEALRDRIVADDAAKCGFDIRIFKDPFPANCYGPPIDFLSHPDAEMGVCNESATMLPGGDLGIWSEEEGDTGEACLAAKINSLFSEIEGQVDLAVNSITGILCMANVKGTDALPEEGEEKDFKDDIQEGLDESDTPIDVITAAIERDADTADGEKVYKTEMTSTATVDGDEIETSIHLTHIPADDENSAYRGLLYYTISGEDLRQPGGNCGGSGPKLFAGSILYEKDADGNLKYRMKRASYCEADAEPFDANNEIDGTNLRDPIDNPSGWAEDYNDATINFSKETGEGSFSYSWQAGAFDRYTRSFIAEITADSGGALSGCGFYGFGPGADDADVGTQLSGMFCNWAGPDGESCSQSDAISEKLQKQCFAQNASGIFESVTAETNIEYAPTLSCDSPGAGFEYEGPEGTMISTSVSNDLVDLADMNIVSPTRPSAL